ncbi:MAG: fluoride efflux transporter CrcB [Planctomycetota bacterium]|jgi:CrcB protein
MLKLLVIGLGGFLGALARYGLSALVQRFSSSPFPAGTFIVNAMGCLLMGALMCLVEERRAIGPETRLFLQIGLLGSFTTFSSVGYETFAFLRAGDYRMALVNAGANLLLGLAAVAVGWFSVKRLGG